MGRLCAVGLEHSLILQKLNDSNDYSFIQKCCSLCVISGTTSTFYCRMDNLQAFPLLEFMFLRITSWIKLVFMLTDLPGVCSFSVLEWEPSTSDCSVRTASAWQWLSAEFSSHLCSFLPTSGHKMILSQSRLDFHSIWIQRFARLWGGGLIQCILQLLRCSCVRHCGKSVKG